MDDETKEPCSVGFRTAPIQTISDAYVGSDGIERVQKITDFTFPSDWEHADGCEALNALCKGCEYKCT